MEDEEEGEEESEVDEAAKKCKKEEGQESSKDEDEKKSEDETTRGDDAKVKNEDDEKKSVVEDEEPSEEEEGEEESEVEEAAKKDEEKSEHEQQAKSREKGGEETKIKKETGTGVKKEEGQRGSEDEDEKTNNDKEGQKKVKGAEHTNRTGQETSAKESTSSSSSSDSSSVSLSDTEETEKKEEEADAKIDEALKRAETLAELDGAGLLTYWEFCKGKHQDKTMEEALKPTVKEIYPTKSDAPNHGLQAALLQMKDQSRKRKVKQEEETQEVKKKTNKRKTDDLEEALDAEVEKGGDSVPAKRMRSKGQVSMTGTSSFLDLIYSADVFLFNICWVARCKPSFMVPFQIPMRLHPRHRAWEPTLRNKSDCCLQVSAEEDSAGLPVEAMTHAEHSPII